MRKRRCYKPQPRDGMGSSTEHGGEHLVRCSRCSSVHSSKGAFVEAAKTSISYHVWPQNKKRSFREGNEYTHISSTCANSSSVYSPLGMGSISTGKGTRCETSLPYLVDSKGKYTSVSISEKCFETIPLVKASDLSDVNVALIEDNSNHVLNLIHKVSDENIITPQPQSIPIQRHCVHHGKPQGAGETEEEELLRIPREEEEPVGEAETRKRFCLFSGSLPFACVLMPYFLVLLFVAVFSVVMPYYVTRNSVMNSLENIHEHIQFEVTSQMFGIFNVTHMLATALVGLYVTHETAPSPADDWVPMGFDMTQRLCTMLRFAPMWFFRYLYVASPERDAIAYCSRGHYDDQFVTVERRPGDGALYRFVAVDATTVNLVHPLKIIKEPCNPVTLQQLIHNVTLSGALLSEWKEKLDAGNHGDFRRWNAEKFMDHSYFFTYPFLEKDGNIAFVKVAPDFDQVVKNIFSSLRASHDQIRILFLDDQPTISILATNSDLLNQSLVDGRGTPDPLSISNDSCSTMCKNSTSFTSNQELVVTPYLTLSDLNDSLLTSVIDSIDVESVFANVRSGEPFFTRFPYDNAQGTISMSLARSEFNASFILFIVMPPRLFDRTHAIERGIVAVVFLSTISVFVGVYCVIEVCVRRPLKSIAEDLRNAARVEGAPSPTTTTIAAEEKATSCIRSCLRHRGSFLSEIQMLQVACASLQDQLTLLRSFLPQGLFQSGNLPLGESNLRGTSSILPDSLTALRKKTKNDGKPTTTTSLSRVHDSCFTGGVLDDGGGHINVFKDIACAVVTVHFSNVASIVEHAAEMASVVVSASADFGGCIDIILPELFLISFRSDTCNYSGKLEATRCACEIYQKLSSGARRYCNIVIDSGTFHFGVCGGPEKRELVFWGRFIGSGLNDIQRRCDIPIAITHPTVPFISSSLHVLPFAAVRVQVPDGPSPVTLYALIDDVPDPVIWRTIEEVYSRGFSHLLRHARAEARMCFEGLLDSPYVTAQLTHCLHLQLAHTEVYDMVVMPPTPSLQPHQHTKSYSVNHWNAGFLKYSLPSLLSDEISTSEGDGELSLTASEMVIDDAASCDTTSTWHSTHKKIPHELWDADNVRWTRANEPFPEQRRFPVFLGISDTGSLAAIKFFLCSSIEKTGYSSVSELERVWDMGRGFYHENIVQILGYGRVKECLCLILEYLPGGCLRDSIRRYGRPLPLAAIKRFVVSALRGLEYLHSRKVVHGNIRPECIMLAVEGLCKLRGVAAMTSAISNCRELNSSYSLESHVYCSPEVLETGRPSAEADIYAVGVLLLELITNQMPWYWTDGAVARMTPNSVISDDHNTSQQQQQQQHVQLQQAKRMRVELLSVLSDIERMWLAVRRGDLALREIPPDCDPLLREVLNGCLESDPANRRTATQLLSLLTPAAPLAENTRE